MSGECTGDRCPFVRAHEENYDGTIDRLRAELAVAKAEVERLRKVCLDDGEECAAVALRDEVERLIAKNDILRIECVEAAVEVARLRFGLDMIVRCADAPDPVGALHTVIVTARKALDGAAGRREGSDDTKR
jgi:hypothetical protein